MLYSNTILSDMNEGSEGGLDATTGTVIVGIVNFIGAMTSTIPLKYYGRKTILMVGHFAMSICMALIGIFDYYENNTLVLVFIFIFIFVFMNS